MIACCCLHNLMRVRYPTLQNSLVDQEDPETHELVPGTWRDEATLGQELSRLEARKCPLRATELRHYLVEYLNNEGSVEWQEKMI